MFQGRSGESSTLELVLSVAASCPLLFHVNSHLYTTFIYVVQGYAKCEKRNKVQIVEFEIKPQSLDFCHLGT